MIVYFILGWRCFYVDIRQFKGVWLPFLFSAFGGALGFVHGAPMAAVIASLYVQIPYQIGSDIATGVGVSQAILIIYIHSGRAKFVHYLAFSGWRAPSMGDPGTKSLKRSEIDTLRQALRHGAHVRDSDALLSVVEESKELPQLRRTRSPLRSKPSSRRAGFWSSQNFAPLA